MARSTHGAGTTNAARSQGQQKARWKKRKQQIAEVGSPLQASREGSLWPNWAHRDLAWWPWWLGVLTAPAWGCTQGSRGKTCKTQVASRARAAGEVGSVRHLPELS